MREMRACLLFFKKAFFSFHIFSGFQKKGFHKMTEQSRDKFMKAVFGKVIKIQFDIK